MPRKVCENCGELFWLDGDDEYYCCEECESEANGEDDEDG